MLEFIEGWYNPIVGTHLSAKHRSSGTRSHRPMECESPKPLPVH